jgi:hypothetical protein
MRVMRVIRVIRVIGVIKCLWREKPGSADGADVWRV